jgi:hypothetical protein
MLIRETWNPTLSLPVAMRGRKPPVGSCCLLLGTTPRLPYPQVPIDRISISKICAKPVLPSQALFADIRYIVRLILLRRGAMAALSAVWRGSGLPD